MPPPPARRSVRLNQGVGACGCGAPDDTAMVRCGACGACKHLSCAGLQRKPSSSRAWSCATCRRVLQQQRTEARHRAGAMARRAKESERRRTADTRAIAGTVQMLVRKVEPQRQIQAAETGRVAKMSFTNDALEGPRPRRRTMKAH